MRSMPGACMAWAVPGRHADGRVRIESHQLRPRRRRLALSTATATRCCIQFYDVGAVFVYCAIGTFIILKVIDMIIGLRVSPEVEVEGLDINLHGETVHG